MRVAASAEIRTLASFKDDGLRGLQETLKTETKLGGFLKVAEDFGRNIMETVAYLAEIVTKTIDMARNGRLRKSLRID